METSTFILSMVLIYAFALISSGVNWKDELFDMVEFFNGVFRKAAKDA